MQHEPPTVSVPGDILHAIADMAFSIESPVVRYHQEHLTMAQAALADNKSIAIQINDLLRPYLPAK